MKNILHTQENIAGSFRASLVIEMGSLLVSVS